MIKAEDLKDLYKGSINARKKLDWHQRWREGSPFIEVVILGFRHSRAGLKIYYNYKCPNTGTRIYDSDLSNQFKINK